MKSEKLKFVNVSRSHNANEGCVKKLSDFHTFCHTRCLDIETSMQKFYRIMKEAATFVGKVYSNLMNSKIFYSPHTTCDLVC
jgi:hypothetical protein